MTDNQLAYQIKVNYLISDMEKVKQEVAEIKNAFHNVLQIPPGERFGSLTWEDF